MYIFWDNSNIQFVGRNNVCPVKEPDANQNLYRTHFKNLFDLVRNNRAVDKAFFVGSIPPPKNELWSYIDALGIEKELLKRTAENKENAVDVSIQAALMRIVIDYLIQKKNPKTITLLTGDGAGNTYGKGFLADLERVHCLGWNIEVYSWAAGCNRYLKKFAENNGKFIPLEDYYYQITFIQYGRYVKPLHLKV
jgi:hypothetical protein